MSELWILDRADGKPLAYPFDDRQEMLCFDDEHVAANYFYRLMGLVPTPHAPAGGPEETCRETLEREGYRMHDAHDCGDRPCPTHARIAQEKYAEDSYEREKERRDDR